MSDAPDHLKDHLAESFLFRNRMLVAAVLVVIMAVALVARMIWLQGVQHAYFNDLANSNRIQTMPITPPRGLILDRKGRILAVNRPDLSVEILPEQVTDMDATLKAVGRLITLSDDDINGFYDLLDGPRHRWEPVPLRNRLTDVEAARLAASEFMLPGVHIVADTIRYYPYQGLLSHVIGYVSRINTKDLKAMTPAQLENYQGTHFYGHSGIERSYEARLHGQVGYRRVEVNAHGRVLKVLSDIPPVRGDNLQLYLDLDVQQAAWDALGDRRGAVVAIDPRSGGVLALVSRPGFDPNLFVTGISHQDYQTLRTDPDQPLFDRALQGQYPPGSTIKPFMGLAGLAYHVTNWQKTIYDPGYFQLPGVSRRYRDWKHSGHGIVDLTRAIQVSCDVYFYTLGSQLGVDRIDDFLQHFKFGQPTGLDIFGEANGNLPSRAWKRAKMRQPWYDGDTVNMSIGQGFMLATPLQLATAAAILSRDGHTMSPRLADIQGQEQPAVGGAPLLDNPTDWERMREAMVSVTSGAQGTARYISEGAKYSIAGKTGTAQVFSLDGAKYNANMLPSRLRDNALFIGFAPADNPAIVIAVMIENGAHDSGVSAPSIARRTMDAWLLDSKGNLAIPPAEPAHVSAPVAPAPMSLTPTSQETAHGP